MSISLPSSSLRGLTVTIAALLDREVEKSRCGFRRIFGTLRCTELGILEGNLERNFCWHEQENVFVIRWWLNAGSRKSGSTRCSPWYRRMFL